MKLKSRFSSIGFLEITCDEIEVTIFNNSTIEINDLITNLESIVEDLKELKQSK